MPAPDRIQTCQFAGIVNIYLRTYTTTYPFIRGGWDWNDHSLQPMEFAGYEDASGFPVAFAAQAVDLATGYTRLNVGVSAGHTFANNFAGLCYDGANVLGWVTDFNNAPTLTPSVCKYSMPLTGKTTSYSKITLASAIRLPQGVNNTGMPAVGANINYLTLGDGVYSSSIIDLDNYSYIWDQQNGIGAFFTKLNSDIPLPIFTDASFGAIIPYNGADQVYIIDSTGGTVEYNLIQTNFGTFADTVGVTMVNPATTTLDINALFQTANNTLNNHTTFLGWLQFYHDTQTFNGVTMNGYGILVAPDFSSYEILNIIPMDANANNWNSSSEQKSVKVDRGGALWMKRATIDTLLLVGEKVPPGQVQIPPNLATLPAINLPTTLGLKK